MEKKLHIGGQAVIEGVLMMSPKHYAISVNKKNKIVSKKGKIKRFSKTFFVRGIVNLVNMLSIGFKALIWSANQQATKKEKITKKELFFTVAISIIAAIFFFIIAPLYITKIITSNRGILFNLIDGIIRIMIFLLYIFLISFLKDVKRLFQYHGAEHKAVNCYEANKKLTLENAKKFTTIHARCGTSFIIFVLVLSILIFSLVTSESFFIKLISRILLLPVIIGVSYEFLKFSDKYKNNFFVKILIRPGLWLQKLTTGEPNNKQIMTAINSLRLVLKLEKLEKD